MLYNSLRSKHRAEHKAIYLELSPDGYDVLQREEHAAECRHRKQIADEAREQQKWEQEARAMWAAVRNEGN